MIQIIKNKEGTKIKEFICDKKEDMADIDLRVCEMGTTCFVIEEDIIYILNSKKEWAIVENKLESAINDVETSLTQLTGNTVHLNAQTLTDDQKTQVRTNIGAVGTAVATTSANGLMSSTDKSRLDALYADYSSALSALGV